MLQKLQNREKTLLKDSIIFDIYLQSFHVLSFFHSDDKKEASVSYEEAVKALEEAGGDLTEAMILLERRGRKNRAAGTPGNRPVKALAGASAE